MSQWISPKQWEILKFPFRKDYNALICDGAVRSGKTSFTTIAFIDWAMREFDKTNFAICGRSFESVVRNVIMPYMALTYHRNKYFIKWVRSTGRLTVRSAVRENTFLVFGGGDESKFALIQGLTAAGILFDEVALQVQSFVEEALARCLTFENRKYWFNCNPQSPEHWFYKEWIQQPEKHKALYLHFTMHDNPILTDEVREQAANDFSGVFYERKVLGLWVLAEGLIYPHYKDAIVKTEDRAYTEYQISADYGISNPMAFALFGYCDGVWYMVDEYYHSGRDTNQQKIDEDYLQDLKKFVGAAKISRVIVDPSALSFINLLRRSGWMIKRADNDVLNGISDTATALKTGKMKINDRCRNALKEFSLYSWDNKAKGEDRPIKEHDHIMDSLRYFVYTNKIVRGPARLLG